MSANWDTHLDRMLGLHQGRDVPETYRVITSGSFKGWGDVEEREGSGMMHQITILADSMDYLSAAQYLAQKLCVSMRREMSVETEGHLYEAKGTYTFDEATGTAILQEDE